MKKVTLLVICKVRLSALASAGVSCYITSMKNSGGAAGAKNEMLAEQQDNTQKVNLGQLTDFDFRPHRAGFQAVGLFPNNFGVSVIPETDQKHYEVAILQHDDGKRATICVTSGITNDVLRFLSRDSVHDVIAVTRNLKPGTFVYDEPEVCE